MESSYNGPPLEAIAIGTGPSFYKWKDTEVMKFTNEEGIEYSPRLIGCGVVPLYINGLFAYCYGDSTHLKNIPDPKGPYHPGCLNYSGTRNLQDRDDRNIDLLPYASFEIPHGNSSGGMAFSLACLHHNVIGIVGFDGYKEDFTDVSEAVYKDFVFQFRYLINYWQNRGRRIVSLMEQSVFNPIIEPEITRILYRT